MDKRWKCTVERYNKKWGNMHTTGSKAQKRIDDDWRYFQLRHFTDDVSRTKNAAIHRKMGKGIGSTCE